MSKGEESKRPPGTQDRRIWVDGELVPWDRATVHVLGQSIQRGSLVFDVMSCHWLEAGPAVFGLREHVERFANSARISGMKLALDVSAVIAAIGVTVRANPGATQVKVSGYYASPSLDVLPRDAHASIAIAAYDARDIVPDYPLRKPPAALQVADPRKMPEWVQSPQAKLAASYLYTAIAKGHAREAGFDDVLLLDEDGNLAESSTTSFFWVSGGAIHTAPVDFVLAGVTRGVVIDLARDEGLAVHEERQPLAALDAADEAFLTGSTTRIWGVGRVDEHRWPSAPGPITRRLAERLDRLLEGKDTKFSPAWIQPV